jgi:hypothetical protein
MKMQVKVLLTLLLLIFFPLTISFAETWKEKIEQLRQESEAADTAIVFYGKVKDQNGQPVTGAKVKGELMHFSLNALYFVGESDATAETDTNGNFTFQNLKGKEFSIASIKKEGYEFIAGENPNRSFKYVSPRQEEKFTPIIGNPIVFLLHKKNDPGLVISKDCQMILKPIWEGFEIDLFKGFKDPLTKVVKEKIKSDIIISINPALDPGVFSVDISAVGENNGLIEKSGDLHVAPEGGYQPSMTYTITKGQETKKTIYHKGRNSKVYSRLEITLKPIETGIAVRAEFFINIVGLKNTEWDFDFTEKQVGILMGKNIEYGSREYREAISTILKTTIQKNP